MIPYGLSYFVKNPDNLDRVKELFNVEYDIYGPGDEPISAQQIIQELKEMGEDDVLERFLSGQLAVGP